MKRLIKLIYVAAAMSVFASSAADLSNPPTSIKLAQQNGIELLEHFKTPNDMDGWLVKNKSGYNIWYSDEIGYVYVGAFLDPAGTNLTAKYLKEKAPKTDYSAILDRLTTINTTVEPTDNPVFVFYEPHCGYCSAVHAAIKPYVDRGAEVRWIPVAFLKAQSSPGVPSSFELIAGMLKSDDPLQVLEQHEALKAAAGGRGGLTSGLAPDAEVFRAAEVNSQVMKELGFGGTPALVYFDETGELNKSKGFPAMPDLPKIFRMERQDSSDGRLARFQANPTAYPVK